MTPHSRARSPWQRARWGVSASFFVAGAALASWVAYIPLVQRRLGLSDGDLGSALFGLAAGALTAVLVVGTLIERFGSRRVVGFSGTLLCLVLPIPIFAPTVWTVAGALFLFGAAFGSLDVAMNSQAANVQRTASMPLMSGFHGLFSVGGLAGAMLAGIFLSLDVSPLLHPVLVAVAMGSLCAISSTTLLETPEPETRRGLALTLPAGPLVGLSLLGFLMFVGEGAIVDWTAVFLSNVLHVSPGVAVSGYAAFALSMAIGRFFGDIVTAWIGSRRLAIASALLAALGLGLAVSTSSVVASVIGFAIAGLGIANQIPILFSRAADSTPDAPQKGIAGVAGFGYFGLVAGPPCIGHLSEAIGLSGSLGVVAASMALVAISIPAAFRAAARVTRPPAATKHESSVA